MDAGVQTGWRPWAEIAGAFRDQLAQPEFQIPAAFDLGAIFLFALTGAIAAMRRGYDYVGLFTLAFLTGLGGGLMRDGLFLQGGPPLSTKDPRYLMAVFLAGICGLLAGHWIERFQRVVAVLDALGMGAYSVVGVQKALTAGLSVPAAMLVGVVNAVGGGILRDIITREEPLCLRPGQFYVLASFAGCATFVGLEVYTEWSAVVTGSLGCLMTFALRVLAIVFNWRTIPAQPLLGDWERFRRPPREAAKSNEASHSTEEGDD